MSTAATYPGTANELSHERTVTIVTPADEYNEHHSEEELMPRHDEDREYETDDIRRLIAREVRDCLRENSNGSGAVARSADTLRRDIGILAILLGMMVQTGAAFYWAGGVSRAQESAKEVIQQVQQEQSYHRAQLQLIDGKLQKLEGQKEAEQRQIRRK